MIVMIQFFLMKIPCFPRFLPEYRSCFGITAYQVCFSMLTYHVRYKFQSRWPGRWIMRSVKKPLFSGAESISLRVPSSAGDEVPALRHSAVRTVRGNHTFVFLRIRLGQRLFLPETGFGILRIRYCRFFFKSSAVFLIFFRESP